MFCYKNIAHLSAKEPFHTFYLSNNDIFSQTNHFLQQIILFNSKGADSFEAANRINMATVKILTVVLAVSSAALAGKYKDGDKVCMYFG